MNMVEYAWIWLNMDEYGWTWMNMDEYGWIWLNMDEYGWIWMNTVEWYSHEDIMGYWCIDLFVFLEMRNAFDDLLMARMTARLSGWHVVFYGEHMSFNWHRLVSNQCFTKLWANMSHKSFNWFNCSPVVSTKLEWHHHHHPMGPCQSHFFRWCFQPQTWDFSAV